MQARMLKIQDCTTHFRDAQRSALAFRSLPVRRGMCVSPRATAIDADRSVQQLWQKFCVNVSGEWEGVTATFGADGQPVPLPSYYVPDAFREWDVQLYDWQMQCSALAQPDGNFHYKVWKLMPTVGCEADAVAFTEEVQQALAIDTMAQALPALADGSYSTGPSRLDQETGTARVEACMALPQEGAVRERLRVVQNLGFNTHQQAWGVRSVELFHESDAHPHYKPGASITPCKVDGSFGFIMSHHFQCPGQASKSHEGEYTAGRDLRSCGFRMKNITDQDKGRARLAPEQVTASNWSPSSSVCLHPDAAGQWTTAAAPRSMGVAAGSIISLPLGVWTRIANDGERVSVEAGVETAEGKRRLARRTYMSGGCAEILLQDEMLP